MCLCCGGRHRLTATLFLVHVEFNGPFVSLIRAAESGGRGVSVKRAGRKGREKGGERRRGSGRGIWWFDRCIHNQKAWETKHKWEKKGVVAASASVRGAEGLPVDTPIMHGALNSRCHSQSAKCHFFLINSPITYSQAPPSHPDLHPTPTSLIGSSPLPPLYVPSPHNS